MTPYYEADGVTLYCGDSLAVLADLPDGCADAIITDPPYSSGGQFRGDRMAKTSEKYQNTETVRRYGEFTGDNRDQRAFGYWCALWLGECLRLTPEGAPICLFSDWRQLPTTTDAMQGGGWVWRGIVPWDKTANCRPSLGRFASQCEYIVWGSNGPMPLERNVGCLPGMFSVMVRQDDKCHIAGKPTPLMQQVVAICEPGGVVLDPFMGSGSTGVACQQAGRRFVGIEINERWLEVAANRLAQGVLFAPPEPVVEPAALALFDATAA